jgi:hypothetical protein
LIFNLFELACIAYNFLALGEEADLGVLNFQGSTKVDTEWNVQLTTEPPIFQWFYYWMLPIMIHKY